MKVIIAGSRSLEDLSLVYRATKASEFNITEVVSGKANGIDILGEIYANENLIPIKAFPADWKNLDVPKVVIKYNIYGKYNALAGHQRNEQMAEYADALIAIWDGKSKGTKHMINYMKKINKPVFILDTSLERI